MESGQQPNLNTQIRLDLNGQFLSIIRTLIADLDSEKIDYTIVNNGSGTTKYSLLMNNVTGNISFKKPEPNNQAWFLTSWGSCFYTINNQSFSFPPLNALLTQAIELHLPKSFRERRQQIRKLLIAQKSNLPGLAEMVKYDPPLTKK